MIFLVARADSIQTQRKVISPGELPWGGIRIEGGIRRGARRGRRRRGTSGNGRARERTRKVVIRSGRYRNQNCQNRGHRTGETWLTSPCRKWKKFKSAILRSFVRNVFPKRSPPGFNCTFYIQIFPKYIYIYRNFYFFYFYSSFRTSILPFRSNLTFLSSSSSFFLPFFDNFMKLH